MKDTVESVDISKLNPWSARAAVVLTSKDPVKREPDYATIGGHTVMDKQGKEITFDWFTHEGSAEIGEDGRLRMEWYMKEFDEEFYLESNEGLQELDWDNILKSTIDDVNYEAGYIVNGEEEDLGTMLVSSFTVYLYNPEKKGYEEISFTEEQLKTYNDKVESR